VALFESPTTSNAGFCVLHSDRETRVSILPFQGESSKKFTECQAPSDEKAEPIQNPKSKIQNRLTSSSTLFHLLGHGSQHCLMNGTVASNNALVINQLASQG
jgi:hypothetical protein